MDYALTKNRIHFYADGNDIGLKEGYDIVRPLPGHMPTALDELRHLDYCDWALLQWAFSQYDLFKASRTLDAYTNIAEAVRAYAHNRTRYLRMKAACQAERLRTGRTAPTARDVRALRKWLREADKWAALARAGEKKQLTWAKKNLAKNY